MKNDDYIDNRIYHSELPEFKKLMYQQLGYLNVDFFSNAN